LTVQVVPTARKLRSQNHEEQREEGIQYERLSSGGAGGDTQAAPDKASCKKRYPALTCNESFRQV
jgi:hypothetical protein